MGNINGPMNLPVGGVFEKAFSPILLNTHLMHDSRDFSCVKNWACSTVVREEKH